jgi:hypothetical protein
VSAGFSTSGVAGKDFSKIWCRDYGFSKIRNRERSFLKSSSASAVWMWQKPVLTKQYA